MHILQDYNLFIAEMDRRCHRIVQRHADQIACTRACSGNCCRIHLTVYPVEAVAIALALQQLTPEVRQRIQDRARQTGSFGPCPLLEDRTCLLYDARAVICRTHGLPMRSEYKGHRTVGFCVKNFKQAASIPEEDVIDLTHVNSSLAEINTRFVRENSRLLLPDKRYTMAQALLMPNPSKPVIRKSKIDA